MRSWIAPWLLALAGLSPAWAPAAGPARAMAWQDVGPTVDDNHLSRSPSLAIGAKQRPVVTFVRTAPQSDGSQVANVFVERWDGLAWVPLGAALNTRKRFAAELPRIAVDDQDRPIVAWYEAQRTTGSPYAIYVKRWNGSAWEQLGGALNTDLRGSALSHSMTLDNNHQPVVAMAEGVPGGLGVRVRRWDGSQWLVVGGLDEIGIGFETQVAVDGAGRITVVYKREVAFGQWQLFAKRWDGAAWLPLGGPLNRDPARPAASASLAAAADGTLTVAWQEQADNASKVYAARWSETAGAWLPLGGALDGGVATRSTVIPKLALLKSGQPVVAWTEGGTMQTSVQRWNGSAWVLVGDNPVISAEQRGYDLDVDSKGRPVLAHGESHAIFVGDIRVQRFGP